MVRKEFSLCTIICNILAAPAKETVRAQNRPRIFYVEIKATKKTIIIASFTYARSGKLSQTSFQNYARNAVHAKLARKTEFISLIKRILLQASNSKSAHLIVSGWQFAKVFSPSLSLTSLKGCKALPVTRFRNKVFSSPLSLRCTSSKRPALG